MLEQVCSSRKNCLFSQHLHSSTPSFISHSISAEEALAAISVSHSSVQISGFLKQKGELEEVEAALSTAPIAVPGLHRLVEGVRAGHAWVAKVETSGLRVQMAELKALEGLVSEGQRLPVALPHLKVDRTACSVSGISARAWTACIRSL